MTLLINYRPVLREPTGIGVYAQGVLPALERLPHVLIPGGERGTPLQRLRRLVWTQSHLPRLALRHRASLVFTPAPEGYLGPQAVPQVVMVHDLRPITHPEASMQSLYFRSWVPPLLRSCRGIITNSQFTAREIERTAAVPPERIAVIPLGYDTGRFQPAPSRSPATHPYLLHVGQAYPHKNVVRLLEAFAALAPQHPELRLLLAGKPHARHTPWLQARAKALGLQQRVDFLPYVPLAELPDLYRGALALVYPSLWEGFGLPVLEAMACGTPVITSVGSALDELASGAALQVDPFDTQALAAAMGRVVDDQACRQRLQRLGLERAARYTWATVGAETARVLEGLAGA